MISPGLVFMSSYHNSSENSKEIVKKSGTTLKVLNIIETNPGINSGDIAKNLDMGRNLVKYHVDKLLNKGLITASRKGCQSMFYIASN